MVGRNRFDPTRNLNNASEAFAYISDSVFTKGFLGRSLRENNGVPSVGVHSARRAGVIVDENGKMRCPAGTPNANQFTDINMSNCMVPSAETAAHDAAQAAQEAARKLAGGFGRGTIRPQSPSKEKQIIDAGIGFADANGRLQLRPVTRGTPVKNPITGEMKVIETPEDAIKHIGDGGSLSEIPDDLVMTAILANSGKMGLFGRKPRYKKIGEGGGVNGMVRLEDTITGNMIGYKYRQAPAMDISEPLNEIMGEHFSEALGFEPIPMRIIPAEKRGVTLISELVHNRRSGKIEPPEKSFGPFTIEKLNDNIDKESVWMTALFDSIIVNGDRHTGNYLLETEGKTSHMVPIDNSLGFNATVRPDELYSELYRPDQMIEMFKQAHNDDVAKAETRIVIKSIQKRIRDIDTDDLRRKADELVSTFQAVETNDRTSVFPGFYPVHKRQQYEEAILRLEHAQRLTTDELIEQIIGRTLIDTFEQEKVPAVRHSW